MPDATVEQPEPSGAGATETRRPASAEPEPSGPVPRRIILAGLVGTTLEFYDFFVYGTIAAIAFGPIFFPAAAPGVGVLLSLSTFAVGFLMRPLGAAAFGHLGDRIGRRPTLITTMLIMGGATVLIGLLPSYAQIGFWAPLLLVILRMLQGAAVGGEWGGAVLLVGEYASPGRRGAATSWAQIGTPVGLLLANGVVLAASTNMSPESFESWGWRIPFLASFILIVVGIVLRSRVEESPRFRQLQNAKKVAASPVAETFRAHWQQLLVAIGITVVSFGGYYVFTTVGLSYAKLEGLPSSYGLYGTIGGAAVSIPIILAAGKLSDRLGRRPIYAAAAAIMAGWAFAFFPLVHSHTAAGVVVAIAVGVGGWSILYGAQGAYLAELFPAHVRYTGASLAYQVTGALGGLVPVASLALLEATGSAFSIALFVCATAVVSVVALIVAPETAFTEQAPSPRPARS